MGLPAASVITVTEVNIAGRGSKVVMAATEVMLGRVSFLRIGAATASEASVERI